MYFQRKSAQPLPKEDYPDKAPIFSTKMVRNIS